MVIDDSGLKMCKSDPELIINPQDLIDGTEKLDGNRSHGYGTDVMRLWAASRDSDKNFEVKKEDIDQCAMRLKVFRGLMRQILGNLDGYEQSQIKFDEMSVVDRLMQVQLIQFLT